jgi:two-component system response regulator RegA
MALVALTQRDALRYIQLGGDVGVNALDLVRTVLVVDDDTLIRSGFCRSLSWRGIVPYEARTASEATQLARRHYIQAAFVDLRIGGDSGLSLLPQLLHEQPTMLVVIVTAYTSTSSTVEAMRLGAVDVVPKPATASELLERACRASASASASASIANTGRFTETPSADRALWEHVQRVLADCQGNKSETARRLRKPRSWLHRFLDRPPPVM